MKNRILRVGTVVPSLRIGDVSYNVQAIKECMHAQAAHAQKTGQRDPLTPDRCHRRVHLCETLQRGY